MTRTCAMLLFLILVCNLMILGVILARVGS